MDSATVPEEVWPAIEAVVGVPASIEQHAAGVGGPGVVICHGPAGRAVMKHTTAEEAVFYRHYAPLVRQHGLSVPLLLAHGVTDGGPWLLLEWLPRVLNRPDPQVLPDQLRYLSALHRTRLDAVPTADRLPQRPIGLTARDTDDALRLWSREEAEPLRDVLLAPWAVTNGDHLLSGDPNVTNWGWRSDGALVLFDWAEAGFGHPAYDLPILCGGMPTAHGIREVVTTYLGRHGELLQELVDQWVAWAVTARLTTFVRFLAAWHRGELADAGRRGAEMLRASLREWLQTVRPLVLPFATNPLVTSE